MSLGRREILAGGGAMASSFLLPGMVRAAGFPDRDIDFIIPYGPGGGFDQYVRAVIPSMQARIGRKATVVPTNLEGAGGARAANQIYRAKPDGYTISIMNVPGIIILQAQGGLSFDAAKLTWLCNMGADPYGLAVPAKSPLHTIDDLRTLSKKRPVRFTGVGPAGTTYSATRIGAALLGFNAQIITGYKGSNDQVVAAIRGDGDCTLVSLTALSQFQDSGMIRTIATFEEHSSIPGAEDATSLKQPDLAKIMQVRPVAAPPNLPHDLTLRLSALLVDSMNDPAVTAWAKANRANLRPDDAAATARLFQDQVAFMNQWKKYIL